MLTTLDLTLGALEVGIAISTCLYGVTTVQAYLYACSEHKDSFLLQFFVLCVWIIETLDTVALWGYIYVTTVTHFGQPAVLDQVPWYLAITVTLSACVGSSTQAFFAYRVKVISGRWSIAIVAWAGALLRLAFGITSCVASIRAKSLSRFSVDWKWLIIGSTIVEMVVDLWNTGALCYYLVPKRGNFSRTRSLINKILLWAVETGMITCIGAILMLIFALALPHALLWVSIITFYPKLYSISLLVSLNGRQDLRRPSSDSITYRSVLWTHQDQTTSAPVSVRKTIEVEMSPVHSQGTRHSKTTTHVQDDEESYIAHTKNPPY